MEVGVKALYIWLFPILSICSYPNLAIKIELFGKKLDKICLYHNK